MEDIEKILLKDREALDLAKSFDGDSGATVSTADHAPTQEDIDSSSTTYLSRAFLSRFNAGIQI